MLENLRVTDIAVHEVFTRGADRKPVAPEYANHLEMLQPEAMAAFRLRVTDALSARSRAVEMQINKTGPGSFHGDAEVLIKCRTPADFLNESRRIPQRLADAQTSQSMPGGIVIVFRGLTGPDDRPFVGTIKAEMQAGFRRRRDGLAVTTEFVNDLFLTQATRLYKIGFLVAPAPHFEATRPWQAIVYDHKIVPSHREAAALYFYEVFLGCGFMEDSAYETARFFNLTREFATSRLADRDQRHQVQDAVFTYVKSEQAPLLSVDEFAERFMPLAVKDQYRDFMSSKQFPERSVRRDTANIKGRLKRRRFKYGDDIEFSASPEAMNERRVSIDTITSDGAEAGPDVTVITIRDVFKQEL